MFRRMLLVLCVSAVLLGCGHPRPGSAPTATATALPTYTPTVVPTWTPTATRTATATPTETPTCTATPTETPEPTETPVPTATRTATPTVRRPTTPPQPAATNVPEPTETPTPVPTETPIPSPTSTPTPAHPYRVVSVRTEANCNFTEARGRIYNTQGQPLAGARVKVIVPGYEWNAVSHPTSASGEFDLHLGLGPKPGHWEFFVVEADRRVSEIVPFDSNNDCRMGRQLIFIEFAKNY